MHIITNFFRYSIGLFKNIFNPAISIFTQIDPSSNIDKKAKIYAFTKVYHSEVGRFSYVGRNSRLVHARIGKFCSIAGDVKIGMANHTLSNISTSPIFTEKNNGTGHKWSCVDNVNPYTPVIVGNDVWIGEQAMILGGVRIGNGAIIGAGAIVTHNIPPYAIAVGVPARVIRFRFDKDIIALLESIHWWDKDEEILKKSLSYFQNSNIVLSELKTLSKILTNN